MIWEITYSFLIKKFYYYLKLLFVLLNKTKKKTKGKLKTRCILTVALKDSLFINLGGVRADKVAAHCIRAAFQSRLLIMQLVCPA